MRLISLAACASLALIPTRSRANTEDFLKALEGGMDCYDAYQKSSARGNRNWAAYVQAMRPALDKLADHYNARSWGEFMQKNHRKEWEEIDLKLHALKNSDAARFLDLLSGKKTASAKDLKVPAQIEKQFETNFIQFIPNAYADCTHSFRLSASIDETLSEAERYKELARVLPPLVTGTSQYLGSLTWFKIETPEYLRLDPILLRFCYDTPHTDKAKAAPDRDRAMAIINEVNQKLKALKFKSSKIEYPPAQG